MLVTTGARANARALACGLALGAAAGVVLGGAYLAGASAHRADARAQADRLSGAAAQGFSELALRGETSAMEPGALAVAERHDPFTLTGDAKRNQETAMFAVATLMNQALGNPQGLNAGAANGLQKASYAPVTPEARPFRLQGAAASTSRDLDCLADAVYYEARGETSAGQAAIAQVVLNRVRHPAFPKTVCGVVFQGAQAGDTCQFSFACDGSMNKPREETAWKRARAVAAHALAGFVMPSVGDATHFHVAGFDPGWGPRLLRVAQIGLHVFYRFGGYAGAPGSFSSAHVERSPPGSELGGHAVYASMIPIAGPAANSGGRPSAQYVAAAATLTADGTKPMTVPSSPPPAVPPSSAAAAASRDVAALTPAAAAPRADEASPKAKTDLASPPAAKPVTTAQPPRPLTLAAAS
ncbi:MAG: cell wall hydrolase [Caulobacteraceae bacterium]|nr:cell wall hydrolase [Caulobacteraceae bacterium]